MTHARFRSQLVLPAALAMIALGLLDPRRVLADTPLGSEWTYQGRITLNGEPVEPPANVTLLFQLYDMPTGGNLEASDNVGAWPVQDGGLVSVPLDFGLNPFSTGEQRWLQVTVNGNALSPRQLITPAPFALYALNAGSVGIINALDASDGNPVDAVFVDSVGRVGIGTTTPGHLLHLAGAVSPTLRWEELDPNDPNAPVRYHIGIASADNTFRITETSVGDRITIQQSSGNVGIGTTAPANRLSVAGSANITGSLGVGEAAPLARLHVWNADSGAAAAVANAAAVLEGSSSLYLNLLSSSTSKAGLVWGDPANSSVGSILYGHANDSMAFSTNSAIQMTLDSAGNVGIGTESPDAKLHVSGLGHFTSDVIIGSALSSGLRTLLESNAVRLYDPNGTRVFNMYSNAVGGGSEAFWANGAGVETIEVDPDESDAGVIRVANAAGTYTVTIDGGDGNGDGRVITQVLEITGGSDLSENFDIAESNAAAPESGMVVSIDTTAPGQLAVSRRAYDRTVAGVISGAGGVKTGMLMGQAGSMADGRHPVALTGRVYVWCDARTGAIHPGDLLTTSDTPGHAMKVSDHAAAQGAILGKAMSALETGRGLVLVLVSLQ